MDEFVEGLRKGSLFRWMNARIEKRQLIYKDEFMEGLRKDSSFTWMNS